MKIGILAIMMVLCGGVIAQKMGHVHIDKIMPDMPEYKEATAAIQKRQLRAQQTLRRMDSLMKVRYNECSDPNISDAELRACQEDIADFQQRIQARSQKLEQEIATFSQTEQGIITEKIQNSIRKTGEAGGYTYVFDASVMYYIKDGSDLTDAVRKDLGLKPLGAE